MKQIIESIESQGVSISEMVVACRQLLIDRIKAAIDKAKKVAIADQHTT